MNALDRCQIYPAIAKYKNAISQSKKKDDPNLSRLRLNLSICYLSLQMTRKATKNLTKSIENDQTYIIAHFFLGVSKLWMSKEQDAINIWTNALNHGGPLNYFSFMRRLTIDQNARAFLYRKRFDALSVLKFLDEYNDDIVFCDNDIQIAYRELENNSYANAINQFNLILANDPTNIEALRGRGAAECLSGQWKKAIEDLTYVIESYRSKTLEKQEQENNENASNIMSNDRESYLSLSHSASKYRGFAYAALGNYTAAIADLTESINNSHHDNAALCERAKIHLIRKSYRLALDDFSKIPLNDLTDLELIDIAECYYGCGDISRAMDMIQRTKVQNDSRKAFLQYLIYRDSGHTEDATKQILHAVELSPSFNTYRNAADFLYEQGKFLDAIQYYKLALEKKNDDAETLRYYALALFQSGSESQAIGFFKKLQAAYDIQKNEIDLFKENSNNSSTNRPARNLYLSLPTEPVLKAASGDLHYILHIIDYHDKAITEAARKSSFGNNNSYSKSIEKQSEKGSHEKEQADLTYYENFHFEKIQPTEDEISMIIDADRLGEKCFSKAPEVVENKRLMRCFGFSVLCLAHLMKSTFFDNPKSKWHDAIEIIRCIVSLADFKNSIKWTMKDSSPKIKKRDLSPTFFLQRGNRRSPRFGSAMQSAIERLNLGVSENGYRPIRGFEACSLAKLNTLESLYSVVQSDIRHYGTWNANGVTLASPGINLRYLGPHGFELYIRPPIDSEDVGKYDIFMQKVWKYLMKDHTKESSPFLSLMILLIWVLQPITHFSHEIGNILLNAYLLASQNIEVERFFNPSGELFIKQMINPNYEMMKKALNDHVLEKKASSTVKDQSLLYWNTLPTISRLYSLIDFNVDDKM